MDLRRANNRLTVVKITTVKLSNISTLCPKRSPNFNRSRPDVKNTLEMIIKTSKTVEKNFKLGVGDFQFQNFFDMFLKVQKLGIQQARAGERETEEVVEK